MHYLFIHTEPYLPNYMLSTCYTIGHKPFLRNIFAPKSILANETICPKKIQKSILYALDFIYICNNNYTYISL